MKRVDIKILMQMNEDKEMSLIVYNDDNIQLIHDFLYEDNLIEDFDQYLKDVKDLIKDKEIKKLVKSDYYYNKEKDISNMIKEKVYKMILQHTELNNKLIIEVISRLVYNF